MGDLHTIENRLSNAASLMNVVHAMRSQAAVYYRTAESALVPIRAWEKRARQCLAGAARMLAAVPKGKTRTGARGVILFTSDQGLCGAFNDRVIDFACSSPTEEDETVYLMVGRRGADLLSLRGFTPLLTEPAPTSLEGVHQLLRDLAEHILEVFEREALSQLQVCYNVHAGPGRFSPVARTILPLDFESVCGPETVPCPGRILSTHLPPFSLVEHLTREYFFILLYTAAVESYASENGARLAAMEAAMNNIEEKVSELTHLRNQLRQEQITAEVLEVAAGASAVENR
ncbi:MAG: F0F1 ATP synthase subunit gamma [Planctomycetota bacterium]|jgi:F-type H+-transporting ATPase subunit gamma